MRRILITSVAVLGLMSCTTDVAGPPREKSVPALSLTDGFQQLTVGIQGPGNILASASSATYTASVSGGSTQDYYYLWSVRMCTTWDGCVGTGIWQEYGGGVNKASQVIEVNPSVVYLQVRVEVGEWTGDPDFVGRTGLSPVKHTLGPAGFGSGGGWSICGNNPSHYPFTRDTTDALGKPAKIDYTYAKCTGGRIYDPAGPRPSKSQGGGTVASVSVTPNAIQIPVGAALQMSAGAFDALGIPLNESVDSWMSTASGVATVSANGLVTGQSTGQTSIIAVINSVADTAVVTVVPPPPRVSLTGPSLVRSSGYCMWQVAVTSESPPYTLEWFIDGNSVATNTSYYDGARPNYSFTIRVDVHDAFGSFGSSSMNVFVDSSAPICQVDPV